MSPCEWKILEWEEKLQTNNKNQSANDRDGFWMLTTFILFNWYQAKTEYIYLGLQGMKGLYKVWYGHIKVWCFDMPKSGHVMP